ncbi:MAG: hypothetical protein WA843_03900, partial [Candidatus Saccharimonadales bacterium]
MSVETMIPPTEAQRVAEVLLEQLLHQPEQLTLFELGRPFHQDPNKGAISYFDSAKANKLRADNPGKLIVEGGVIEDFRLQAASYGAGFQPFEFE